MSEERSRVVRPPVADGREPTERVEELEELGALEDFDDPAELAETGAHRRTSIPPPIPAHARQPQTAAASLPPPRARVDTPPSSPTLETPASWPPSRSGMFRIDRTSTSEPPSAPRGSAPPPPTLASEPAELKRALSQLSQELREHTGQIHRLRLTIRLREDRIRELEAELQAHRERNAAAAQELACMRAQKDADDLKRVSGIGPGFERALHAIGITTFQQIADWTPVELERIAREIRTTPRRILRDRWVDHARELVLAQTQTAADARPRAGS
jgi:predicted flap endonuclease-1-like 5' DNA nuclease